MNNYISIFYVIKTILSIISDASYHDPLGPQIERPKTAAKRRDQVEDEFGDEELGDDLLPE